jgi:hypothetical protein
MQLTSFTKTLLGVGAGVAVVGGGVGLLVARHQRKDAAEAAYRATPMPVDEFVDRTLAAYDRATYPSPYEQLDTYDEAFRTPDGKLAVGAEDIVGEDVHYFPELVSVDEDQYYQVVTGRAFIHAADRDKDGSTTREELVAAITPYAGGDGTLDETERRTVLTEGKLGVVKDEGELESIAGWNSNSMITAHEAATYVLRGLELDAKDEGSPGVRIADVAPDIQWVDYGKRLGSGPITSVKPALAKIDEAGNGNGVLSVREVADWLVEHHGEGSVVAGHLKIDNDAFAAVLEPQQIARVAATTLDGHVYYSDDIPEDVVDRFYGGSIPEYLDATKGFREFRGGAEWEPDPKA